MWSSLLPVRLNHCPLAAIFLAILSTSSLVEAQSPLPYMNGGPNSVLDQLDIWQMYPNKTIPGTDPVHPGDEANGGAVSILDLAAPEKAVKNFEHAAALLRKQHADEAIKLLQNAIALDPDFVSAHYALGLAYLDQRDTAHAKNEFQRATQLDDKIPLPFMSLGMLALSENDFATADENLEKAAVLSSGDARILTALAFAQNGNHKYAEALQTAQQVHKLGEHMSDVHYIAAAAALALHDVHAAHRELSTFLSEDPTNPLIPVARKNLAALAGSGRESQPAPSIHAESPIPVYQRVTFPSNEYLHDQVLSAQNEAQADDCDPCGEPGMDETPERDFSNAPAAYHAASGLGANLFTIHRDVDETTLFFAVNHGDSMVDNLSATDIQIRDNNKPPERILEFIPQSHLPLRLGLLIDISDSVQTRFAFEKRAAERFIGKVLRPDMDLAFVAGFNSNVLVTQDFTSDSAALAKGIEKLSDRGETSLFDAISFACWKLAAYPDEGRVAKVLVVLTDGEDNSSRGTLNQSIQAAQMGGVTVYTVSTTQESAFLPDSESDANKILKLLAERSGGDAKFPGSLDALDGYLGRLREVIRSRYLVAYKPADFVPDGKFRRVHVSARKGGINLHVRVRKGYYPRQAEEWAQN